MKIEKRGKYAGVKIHLEPDEAEVLTKLATDFKAIGKPLSGTLDYFTLAVKIGKKILKQVAEDPTMLIERTPEQVTAALMKDKAKIEAQLAAGEGWKNVN